MIRHVNIQRFRGIADGDLDQLTPLVILVGPNSAGKSAVLDAMVLGAAPSNEHVAQISARRQMHGGGRQNGVAMVYRLGDLGPADIKLWSDEEARRVVLQVFDRQHLSWYQINIPPAVPERLVINWTQFVQQFPNPEYGRLPDIESVRLVDPRRGVGDPSIETLYTTASMRGLRTAIWDVVRPLLPGFQDMEILAPENQAVLYLNLKDQSLPLSLAGDGVQLLVRDALMLVGGPRSVVLLEEPETHMHPAALAALAKVIHGAVKGGTQVIMTTHNLELIDALVSDRTEAELAQISVYRLALLDGAMKKTRLAGGEIVFARRSIEEDLR